MKNILYKSSLLLAGALLMLSCEKNEIPTIDTVGGPTLAQFETTSLTLATPEEGISEEIEVTVTTLSSQERTVDINVDPGSTATADQYEVGSLVIPANSYTGTLTVSGNFDALPESGSSELILNLGDVAGGDTLIENGTLTIELFRRCSIVPEDLVGSWTGVDSWGYPTDFEIFVEDGKLMMTAGLLNGWTQDWWGEIIVTQVDAVELNVNLETFNITIPEQAYMTTTWNGDPQAAYNIKGTGIVVNSCERVIRINPVLVQPDGAGAIDGSAYGPAFSVTLQGDMANSEEPGEGETEEGEEDNTEEEGDESDEEA